MLSSMNRANKSLQRNQLSMLYIKLYIWAIETYKKLLLLIVIGISVRKIRLNFTTNNVIDFHFTVTSKAQKRAVSPEQHFPSFSLVFVFTVSYVAANEIFYYCHRNFSTFSLRCTLWHASFWGNFLSHLSLFL